MTWIDLKNPKITLTNPTKLNAKKLIPRRQALKWILPMAFAGVTLDALVLEPFWIRRKLIEFTSLGIGARLLHFSDLHFKGNQNQLDKIIKVIDSLKPDYICFTGDLVDQKNPAHLKAVLSWIETFSCPVFGVPGNHDPVDPQSIQQFLAAFKKTGGAFLMDESIDLGRWELHGSSRIQAAELDPATNKKHILLCHYPKIGDLSLSRPYDLALAGHSHGGQVRIPFIGAPIVPFGVGPYVRGLFKEAPVGPLYVNPGVGTFLIPVRFCCRPEVTLFLT